MKSVLNETERRFLQSASQPFWLQHQAQKDKYAKADALAAAPPIPGGEAPPAPGGETPPAEGAV